MKTLLPSLMQDDHLIQVAQNRVNIEIHKLTIDWSLYVQKLVEKILWLQLLNLISGKKHWLNFTWKIVFSFIWRVIIQYRWKTIQTGH